ncbi:fluoride efflux transporter FluC [Salibacterium aidingense]|uniref:fluoride efflux transporter FluC n=1 Tax=Salibacterium aidingense TaxID=384933 RepID=UPI003BC9C1ED
MKNVIAVGIGGAAGTYLRYIINTQLPADFPVGTMIENITGSLLLGLLSGWFAVKTPRDWVKAGLGAGLCGGYTTFSTFAADTVDLYTGQMIAPAVWYMFVTLFLGIIFAMIGFAAGQKAGGEHL